MGYSPQSDLSGEQWLMLVLALALTLGLWLTTTAAPAQTAPADTVAQIKADFDQAMAKPLAERIPDLEALEQQIATDLFEKNLADGERIGLLEFQYRVQVNLAKYPEAHTTFGAYAQALKNWDQRGRGKVAVKEFIRRILVDREFAECEALANEALSPWGDDPEVAPALLFYKARSLRELNGRAQDAIPVLKTIISDHLNSSWRPKAMRELALLQASGLDSVNNALSTLSLMEEQYRGTVWEQVAHMIPAAIFEAKQGDPQRSMQRYQDTLTKFPDHKFTLFCRAQIERLQGVIEQQLIQDALDGLGKNGDEGDPDVVTAPVDEVEETQTLGQLDLKNIPGSQLQ